MTIFGIDLSHYQPNMCVNLAHAQGYGFVVLKCSEGAGWKDESFAAKLAIAQDLTFPPAAYHFVNMTASAAAQVANVKSMVPRDVPVWLDVEAGATKAHAKAIGDALRASSWNVPGMYVSSRPPTGYAWWRPGYGADPTGYGATIYPGDDAAKWVGQDIWQYGQHGKLDGYGGNVDVNAVRGMTLTELHRTGWFQTFNVQEEDVATLDAIAATLEAFRKEEAARYAVYTSRHADICTRIAGLLTQEQTNAATDSSTLAAVKALTPTVDPTALAEALAPLIGTLTDADITRIATAVAEEQARRLEA
jgi:lysozyme